MKENIAFWLIAAILFMAAATMRGEPPMTNAPNPSLEICARRCAYIASTLPFNSPEATELRQAAAALRRAEWVAKELDKGIWELRTAELAATLRGER